MAYDSELWGAQQPPLKYREMFALCIGLVCVCVCVCPCTKCRKEAALAMWKPMKAPLLHPFVHAHICLHLRNACSLLRQRCR